MSKQLDIFIESLGTLLSPFVIDYNFILCKNIYKNTVDGYSGNWGSSLIYGNNIYNKDFANIPYMLISSVAQEGLTELKDKLWQMLNKE